MKKIVVIGIGYVGTAVACAFAKAGYRVVGIDNQRWKVDAINKGISPIEGDEPGLKELLRTVVKQKKLSATTDFSACRNADTIIVAVNTPVRESTKEPEYGPLKTVIREIGRTITRARS